MTSPVTPSLTPEQLENLTAALPEALRGSAGFTRMAAGLSGAGVYRVEAKGQSYVLKLAASNEAFSDWERRLSVQQHAAEAGVAPALLHSDASRRAVLSEFVSDKSFAMLYGHPGTRAQALQLLGQTLRRIQQIPPPAGAQPASPFTLLTRIWSGLEGQLALPAFVGQAVRRLLAETAPPLPEPLVMSHNDVNPTNLVYDGERLLLLDWDTAAPNDLYYDLAAIATFLRMDHATSLQLLGMHAGGPVTALPERFVYDRRVVAVMCGTVFLHLAHKSGHAGGESLDGVISLAELYLQLRTGAVNIATAEGQWKMGLALIQEDYSA